MLLLPTLKLPLMLSVLPEGVQVPVYDWHDSEPIVNELAMVTSSQPVIGVVGVNSNVRVLVAPSILLENVPVMDVNDVEIVLVTDALLRVRL